MVLIDIELGLNARQFLAVIVRWYKKQKGTCNNIKVLCI
ncbi:hypothetical protein ES705_46437 [subsurface metagenome]